MVLEELALYVSELFSHFVVTSSLSIFFFHGSRKIVHYELKITKEMHLIRIRYQ